MKILCIGHAAYDITMPIESFPKENTKNRFNKKIEGVGGCALIASLLLSKWGNNTYFLGVIGNDYYGKKILNELKNSGVKTKYLEINKYKETTQSFILSNKNGKRTIYTCCDNVKMKHVKLNFKPDVILVDAHEFDVSFDLIKKYNNAISIIDASRVDDDTIDLCKMVNYVVCSLDFAEKLTNIKVDYSNFNTLTQVHNILEEKFKNNIIVTLEEKGCLCKLNDEIKIIPSIEVNTVDSTGAGDIFHGAFTHYISRKTELAKTLKLSNIAGGLSTKSIGAINSIVTKEEVEDIYDEFK